MSMPLPAERRSSLSLWGMSSPLSRAHGWACRSLLSGGVPSHSEDWVLHSPELVIGLTLRSEFSALELLIGSWVPLIPRNEFSALQSSPSVELALLPSTRGSPMSMPLPSERPSFSAPQSSVIVPLPNLSGGVPSHSEKWVLRSSELCDGSLSVLVELALLPSL